MPKPDSAYPPGSDSRLPRWILVLPPEGAARTVGEKTWEALCAALPDRQRKIFDTKAYLDGFDKLLKHPTDDMTVDLMNQALVVQCLDFQATHILVLALSPITYFTVDLLKRHGITTLHWFYEDYREARYWREVLPAYHYFLAIQRGPLEAACREKGTRFHFLPTALTIATDRPARAWANRSVDIAFIGFPSAYRVSLLEGLARAGFRLQVAGSGWDKYHGPLEACLAGRQWTGVAETAGLLESARIGLHIPSENPALEREHCHISPRIFDILASGCLLLCEEAPLIRESLPGAVYRSFMGSAGLVDAVRSALREGFSDSTAAANRELVLREHTFGRRISEILGLAG
jgi:hypothetical protein